MEFTDIIDSEDVKAQLRLDPTTSLIKTTHQLLKETLQKLNAEINLVLTYSNPIPPIIKN